LSEALAYLFWHRPAEGVDREAYEEALREFHASLGVGSAAFRVSQLPFGGSEGYEDWYLIDGWAALGELNRAAVDARRAPAHGRVAAGAAAGWGAVYGHLGGAVAIPAEARWLDKPRDTAYESFVADLPEATIWQRQLVLGPAPEFCIAQAGGPARHRVA
jgi:hypothetical protein